MFGGNSFSLIGNRDFDKAVFSQMPRNGDLAPLGTVVHTVLGQIDQNSLQGRRVRPDVVGFFGNPHVQVNAPFLDDGGQRMCDRVHCAPDRNFLETDVLFLGFDSAEFEQVLY